MKTVEEAAEDFAQSDLIDDQAEAFNGFIEGAKFTQRWIPVEEEVPPKDVPFLSMSDNSTERISLVCWNKSEQIYNPIANSLHISTFGVVDITHWRPIDFK